MSFTTTQTQTKQQSEVLNLVLFIRPLTETIRGSLNVLIKSIDDSAIFDKKKIDEIQAWRESFIKDYLQSLNSDKEKFEASLQICFLLCEIIEPEFPVHKDNEQHLYKLLEFAEETQNILKELLPASENLEEFIKTYKQYSQEEEKFYAQLERIESVFQQQMDLLTKAAQESNAKIAQHDENLKQRHLEFNAKRISMMEDQGKRLDALKSKVPQIAKTQLELAVQGKAAGEKADAQINQSKITFTNAKNLLKS